MSSLVVSISRCTQGTADRGKTSPRLSLVSSTRRYAVSSTLTVEESMNVALSEVDDDRPARLELVVELTPQSLCAEGVVLADQGHDARALGQLDPHVAAW
jgi:hypothetical protein